MIFICKKQIRCIFIRIFFKLQTQWSFEVKFSLKQYIINHFVLNFHQLFSVWKLIQHPSIHRSTIFTNNERHYKETLFWKNCSQQLISARLGQVSTATREHNRWKSLAYFPRRNVILSGAQYGDTRHIGIRSRSAAPGSQESSTSIILLLLLPGRRQITSAGPAIVVFSAFMCVLLPLEGSEHVDKIPVRPFEYGPISNKCKLFRTEKYRRYYARNMPADNK